MLKPPITGPNIRYCTIIGHWYDVDFAEVIELRKSLFPVRNGYHMIASPATEPGWLEQIPVNRPTLILAEGANTAI